MQSGRAVRRKVGGTGIADVDVEDSEIESSENSDGTNPELSDSTLETASIPEKKQNKKRMKRLSFWYYVVHEDTADFQRNNLLRRKVIKK